jgi:hypothetical protein
MRRTLHSLSLLLLAVLTTASGCNCDDVYVHRVTPQMQVLGDDGEVVDIYLCRDGEGNSVPATGCTADFGDAALGFDNQRTVFLTNVGNPVLELYKVFIDQESPDLPNLDITGDLVDASETLALGNGDASAVRVHYSPEVEREEAMVIGTLVVITNATNTDEVLPDETCAEHGAPTGCAITRIALRAWPKDLGIAELSIVAQVGNARAESGICAFGYVGQGGEGLCTLTITNLGDRDAVINTVELAIPQDDRSECATSCNFGTFCGAADTCVDGPYSSFEPSIEGGYERGANCATASECVLGEFCAPDPVTGTGFCSDEAPHEETPIFRIDNIDVSPGSPLIVEPGNSVVLHIKMAPTRLARYTSVIRFKGNLPSAAGIITRGMHGTGHDVPVARPVVKEIDGSADYRRNDNDDPQAAPLSTLLLSGTGSTGVGGAGIIAYEWSFDPLNGCSIAEAGDPERCIPEGSGVRFRNPTGSESDIVFGGNNTPGLDSAGYYGASLRVKDERNVWSGWTRVIWEAKPESALHVEMTWDHPSSDVDIHLIQEGDRNEYTSGKDCYYANCNTSLSNGNPRLSWGPAGTEDDPRLDLDDVNGFGPENINIEEPEQFQRYLVGVHYYRADGAGAEGATEVTIRIYLFGILQFEEAMILEDTNNWWDVAFIDLPENQITSLRRVTPGTP